MDNVAVGHEARPRQCSDPGADVHYAIWALGSEQSLGLRGQGLALGGQVMEDEANGAVREHAGADVEVAGVAGAQAESLAGEAMLRDMAVRGSKYGAFDGAELAFGGRVVV